VSTEWFPCAGLSRDPSLRLFCFPYAGGGQTAFRHWSQQLPVNLDLRVLQLPGRERRVKEAPFTSWKPLVQGALNAISPLVDLPFAFFGHSMGALIAFELALELRDRFGKIPQRFFVSACRAPHLPRAWSPHSSEEELLARLRCLNGTPQEVLNDPDLMALLLPVFRADFRLVETYFRGKPVQLTCPLIALGGRRDPSVSPEHLTAWREYTSSDFSLRIFEGDHFFIHQRRAYVLDLISSELMGTIGMDLHGQSPGAKGRIPKL
jgi:medium-chain acyl-[acyl-carrier-protein] hydrolase